MVFVVLGQVIALEDITPGAQLVDLEVADFYVVQFIQAA
jgi:hypothetical protein